MRSKTGVGVGGHEPSRVSTMRGVDYGWDYYEGRSEVRLLSEHPPCGPRFPFISKGGDCSGNCGCHGRLARGCHDQVYCGGWRVLVDL